MKTTKILIAVAIVAAGIANTYAATYDLGLLPSDATSLNSGAGWQANPSVVAPGSFTDTFNFQLDNLLSLNPVPNQIIPGGFFSLTVSPISSVFNAGHYNYTFTASGVASDQWGVYTVDFSGVAAPVIPPTAPVPELETFAMLLAGLGVIGATIRRRKNKAVVAI